MELLNKILSGVKCEAICSVKITIQEFQTGTPAPVVSSPLPEEQWLFDEMGDTEMGEFLS